MLSPIPSESIVETVHGVPFTTTVVIAQHTEVEHKNVLGTLRHYLDEFDEFGRVAFETRPFVTGGGTQSREIALLNESQATLLLTYMRNSDVVRRFKRALVHAFAELRARAQAVDPMVLLNDPETLRGLLRNYSERVGALEATVEQQAPKVAALERIAEAGGALCVTDAAKALQMPPGRLFAWLSQNHWIYRRIGCSNWLAYQPRIASGVLLHKIAVIGKHEDGSNRVSEQVRITPKGMTVIARELARPTTTAAARAIDACETLLN